MSEFNDRIAKLSFTRSARIRVYRQLDRLLRNGVPMRQALDVLYRRASDDEKKPTRALAVIIDHWRQGYKNGKQLGQCIHGWVPVQEQMLIEAGEISGDVSTAFKNVIKIGQRSGQMKGAIIGGVLYPFVLFVMILFTMWGFGENIVPAFGGILPPEQWTGTAASMYTLSQFVEVWTLPILLGMVGLITLYVSTVAIWTGPLRAKFDRIPPWSMYRMWQGASFMMSMAALIRAGVAIPEGLRRIRRNANPYLAERIDETLFHYNTGANFGEALHRTEFEFPDKEIVEDLRVYAGLAGFEESIEMIADEWMDNGVETVRAQARVLNMVMLFGIAGTIGWLGFGLFEIQKQVTSAANAM